MDFDYLEWIEFMVRWFHVIAGIAWIGSSFYFIALDLSLRKSPSLPKGAQEWVRGRLIGTNKMSVEILDTDGVYRYIARDVIVEVRLIAHMRPAYIDDEELLQFEREDHKRRTKIHEDVEKKTKGSDDDHLWG